MPRMRLGNIKIILLILAISLAPRIIMLSMILHKNRGDISVLYQCDAPRYYREILMSSGIDQGLFGKDPFFDVPAYPLILSIFFKVFWPNKLLPVVLNIIFFSLSALVLYNIGLKLFNRKTGVFAAIIYSLYPSLLINGLLPYPDSLFLFFFMCALYFFVLFLKNYSIRNLIFSAIYMAIATLTREITLLAPLAMIFVILVRYAGTLRRFTKAVCILLIVYAAALSPCFIYNYIKFNRPLLSVKTTTVFESLPILLHNNKIRPGEPSTGILNPLSQINNYFRERRHFFLGTELLATAQAMGHVIPPIGYLPNSYAEFIRLLKRLGNQWVIYQWLGWIFLFFVYLLSLASFIYLLIKKRWRELSFFSSFILYFLGIYYLYYSSRYFTSLVPFLALLCAYFISQRATVRS